MKTVVEEPIPESSGSVMASRNDAELAEPAPASSGHLQANTRPPTSGVSSEVARSGAGSALHGADPRTVQNVGMPPDEIKLVGKVRLLAPTFF